MGMQHRFYPLWDRQGYASEPRGGARPPEGRNTSKSNSPDVRESESPISFLLEDGGAAANDIGARTARGADAFTRTIWGEKGFAFWSQVLRPAGNRGY
ncbi:hypothetical protein KM043_000789 [Ampulex compressa]|nr:hypothetical protein KM043_000789 [Ampulex compressa]